MTPKRTNEEIAVIGTVTASPVRGRSALDETIRKISGEYKKDYGDRVITSARAIANLPVVALPTGVLSIDLALGRGGFLKGRIAEVKGPAKDGKTTLLLTLIAESQRGGFRTAYVDAEHKLDLLWAERLGVDLDEMTLITPDHGEMALDITESLVLAGVNLIVIDSVAALTPRAELEGEMGEAMMGVQARLVGQAMRKLNGAAAKNGTALIFINQEREKIGVVYGSPKTTPGGKALEFAASVRIEVRRKGWIKEGEVTVGIQSSIKTIANQVAPPMEEATYDIYSGKCSCHAPGIDRAADLLDVAVARGVVEKAGAWFSLDGEQLGQGRVEAAANLVVNPEIVRSVRERIFAPKGK